MLENTGSEPLVNVPPDHSDFSDLKRDRFRPPSYFDEEPAQVSDQPSPQVTPRAPQVKPAATKHLQMPMDREDGAKTVFSRGQSEPSALTQPFVQHIEQAHILVNRALPPAQTDEPIGQLIDRKATPPSTAQSAEKSKKEATRPKTARSEEVRNPEPPSLKLASNNKLDRNPERAIDMPQTSPTAQKEPMPMTPLPQKRADPWQNPPVQPLPTINVTIGRVEIKASAPAINSANKRPQTTNTAKVMTLDEYLSRREGGQS